MVVRTKECCSVKVLFYQIILLHIIINILPKVRNFAHGELTNPSATNEANLARALPFDELNLDPDGTECQKYGEKLKKFYFGLLPISEETMNVYLHVNNDLFILKSNLIDKCNNFSAIG